MKKIKYAKPKAGQWIMPKKRGYRMVCCDCGLIHRMNFAVVIDDGRPGKRLKLKDAPANYAAVFQPFRAERETRRWRKQERITVKK